ncbi:MAG: hypothetical protein JNG90_05430 [Planctomycetaceae bacterium]|nr:hypothetical protein [Planctomycetaceae bacterium]
MPKYAYLAGRQQEPRWRVEGSLRRFRRRLAGESLEDRRLLAAASIADALSPDASLAGLNASANVTIGSGAVGVPGAAVDVPITIDNADTLQAIDFVIRYDTARLNAAVGDVSLGGLLDGWTLTKAVNDSLGVIVISSFTTSPLASVSGTLFTIRFHVDPAATSGAAAVTLPNADNAFALNEGLIAMSTTPGGIVVNAAGPTVTQVAIGSTEWTASFKNYLAANQLGGATGYIVPFGSQQTTPLPWGGLNQISIVFAENVQVASGDLTLTGVNSAYAIAGFSYNASTYTATWTLTAPIDGDKLLINLSDAVRDDFNKQLDGEWTTGQAAGPSGNGVTGGAFQFRFNVLPGDGNGSGNVDGADYTVWADHYAPTGPLTNHRADLNGDGVVDGADYTIWADHYFAVLPGGEPLAAAVPAAAILQHAMIGDGLQPDGDPALAALPVAIEERTTAGSAPAAVVEQTSRLRMSARGRALTVSNLSADAQAAAAWDAAVEDLALPEYRPRWGASQHLRQRPA